MVIIDACVSFSMGDVRILVVLMDIDSVRYGAVGVSEHFTAGLLLTL
jgi:hypothetical protein